MIKLHIADDCLPLKAKLDYTIRIFHTVFKLPEAINVTYGHDHEIAGDLHIQSGNAAHFFSNNKAVPEEIAWTRWLDRNIPVLFNPNFKGDPIVVEDSGKVTIRFDLLACAFYFLSCWQEWKSNGRDELGRFRFEESILKRLEIVNVPVVNYYFDILAGAIGRVQETKPLLHKYHDSEFIALATHDIDQCTTGWMENSYRALRAGHPVQALNTIVRRFIDKDVWFNFDDMMALESSLEVPAVYFFLSEHTSWRNFPNADYKIESPDIRDAIQSLVSAGHEIGVHGSLGTAWDAARLRPEIEKLALPVKGGRFHFLAISIPVSYSVIEEAGLKYDSSLGFAEHIGFRNGFCYPFQPYHVDEDRVYSFVEVPLMVMDRTLEFANYMGLAGHDALHAALQTVDEVRRFGGVFVFLWHNKSFSGFKYGHWRSVFTDLIAEIRHQGGAFMRVGDLVDLFEFAD